MRRGKAKGGPCEIEGCIGQAKLLGMCKFHYHRQRAGFTAEEMTLPKGFKSIYPAGWIYEGYKWILDDSGRKIGEHRYLMEKLLGRKLHYNETVHHINENKLDNRLSNLQVKTRSAHTREHQYEGVPCRICSVHDRHGSGGFCSKHYQQDRRMFRDPIQENWELSDEYAPTDCLTEMDY